MKNIITGKKNIKEQIREIPQESDALKIKDVESVAKMKTIFEGLPSTIKSLHLAFDLEYLAWKEVLFYLPSTIETLNLTDNDLGFFTEAELQDLFQNFHSIKKLNLSDNYFNNSHSNLLAGVLSCLPNLHEVDLSKNLLNIHSLSFICSKLPSSVEIVRYNNFNLLSGSTLRILEKIVVKISDLRKSHHRHEFVVALDGLEKKFLYLIDYLLPDKNLKEILEPLLNDWKKKYKSVAFTYYKISWKIEFYQFLYNTCELIKNVVPELSPHESLKDEPQNASIWKPNPQLVRDATLFIMDGLRVEFFSNRKLNKSNFPVDIQKLIHEYAKIGGFLRDDFAVKAQLKKLNAKLLIKVHEIEAEYKRSNKEIDIITNLKLGHTKHHKILRTFLENELVAFGFEQKFGKTLGLLKASQFRKMLSLGIVLKDPGAPIKHGEFTHPLQLLMIAYQNSETPFLDYSIVNLYTKLGTTQFIYQEDTNEYTLWDVIFDEILSPSIKFSCPEYLLDFILKSEELDILQLFLKARINKRETKLFFDKVEEMKIHSKNYGAFEEGVLYPKLELK